MIRSYEKKNNSKNQLCIYHLCVIYVKCQETNQKSTNTLCYTNPKKKGKKDRADKQPLHIGVCD